MMQKSLAVKKFATDNEGLNQPVHLHIPIKPSPLCLQSLEFLPAAVKAAYIL